MDGSAEIGQGAGGDRPLDGFLVGPENALAHAGVLALARGGDEAEGVSPLVVHGPAGAGKSRLLAGLVAERLARRPGAAAAHLGAEGFAASCAEAAGRGRGVGWADLRARFRSVDLFVLEDLHALAKAPLALEELAHTLDALAETGAAIAVSARAGPGQWPDVWEGPPPPARLVNRLVSGLAVRVDPPGPALLRRHAMAVASAGGLRLSSAAIEALADRADGFRGLDGDLARLALAARLRGVGARGLDLPTVETLLDEGEPVPEINERAILDRIAREVAARFGVRVRDLRSASRRQAVVVPRHLAILLARQRTGLSFAALGAYFGRRDAKTIRHACEAAASRIAADPALAAAVAALAVAHRPDPGQDGDG